jgi:hypothetical protein
MSGYGKTQKVLAKSQAYPDGIDADKASARMFWTCMGSPARPDGEVVSANLEDGSDATSILPKGVANTPNQLAVEPESKNLYFCDREGMRVLRCNYDGGEFETIIKTGDWEPEGFANPPPPTKSKVVRGHNYFTEAWQVLLNAEGGLKVRQGPYFLCKH